MDLTQLANLGEFIGGVAVLVTLVYLAVQVRQNTRWLQSLAIDSTMQRAIDFHLRFSEPEAAGIAHAMTYDFDAMNQIDRARGTQFLMAILRANQVAFHQNRSGMLPSYVWEGIRVNLRSLIDQPAFRVLWDVRKSMFDPEYTRFVDALVQEPAAVSSHVTYDPLAEAPDRHDS